MYYIVYRTEAYRRLMAAGESYRSDIDSSCVVKKQVSRFAIHTSYVRVVHNNSCCGALHRITFA